MTRMVKRFLYPVTLASLPGLAQAQGLSKARTTLTNFQGEILLVVPIVAVLSLIVLGVLWGLRVIRFHTLVQWGGGILVVGCASQIVNMLLS